MRFLVVVILSVLASQAYAINPGMPGYVDYSKTAFAVGDTVVVFNADDPPRQDRNGYIVPTEWHKAVPYIGTIVQACHRLDAESVYHVKTLFFLRGGIERECMIAIPEQGAVVIQFLEKGDQ